MKVRCKKTGNVYDIDVLPIKSILINSSLVSAQNRKRLYWTNIEGVQQPEDRGLILRDILEYGSVDRDKSFSLTASYSKGGSAKEYFEHSKRQIVMIMAGSIKGRKINANGVREDSNPDIPTIQYVEINVDPNKTNTLTTVEKDNVLVVGLQSSSSLVSKNVEVDNSYIDFSKLSKLEILEKIRSGELIVRKLFPIECERLQTLPDNYTACVSASQRYKQCGNGWTVDVIAHILSYMK